MPERILITGGSGFVGACLAHELVTAGHDVHLLLRRDYKSWRLADIEGRFTPHWADLRDAETVRSAITAARPETVYHLATHGAYPTQKDRADIMATNLQGTINLIEALAKHDYRAFVHAGSSSEYGHKKTPMRETDVLEPRGDYAIGKAAAAHLCLAEAQRGRQVCVVRLFSAYGPWEEPNRLVPYVMGCCLRGENPRVTAGSQPRDFIAVQDVTALLQIAAHRPGLRGKVLHAGTGVQSRVRDMIEAIVSVSGRRVRVQYGVAALRPDEPEQWVASIEQTKALTGWQPRLDLSSGVRAMWVWQQAWAERKTLAA
jgi:nucleoside-diphosphate-sugar epimerase